MTMTYDVKDSKVEMAPAVAHIDRTARPQVVRKQDNPKYHALISEYKRITGLPLVINTSFNVRGEPIVCTPEEAYRCFMATNMDILVMERCVLKKEDQPGATQHAIDQYLAQFQLD